jgi:hypothetical protein
VFEQLFAMSIALELVFELIAVNGDFYAYYGGQPLAVFGLPAHWVTLGESTAYPAKPTEPTRRRWRATIPGAGRPGHLAAGRYRIEILADGRRWTPLESVGDGEDFHQGPAHVDLIDPAPWPHRGAA